MTIVVIKKDEDFEKAMLDKQYVYVWKEGFIVDGGMVDSYNDLSVIVEGGYFARLRNTFTLEKDKFDYDE
jgi:hypothetical protein